MSFTIGSLFFASVMGAAAYTFGIAAVRRPELCHKLPRARWPGEVVGVLCLIWAAHHVSLMLEGGLVRYRIVIQVLVPMVAVLGFFHLDYLFARALGGLLLLAVNFLLHAGFVVRVPARPVFSTGCYVLGIIGLVFVAAPWRLRDLLELARDSSPWRRSLTAICGALSAFFAAFAFLR